MLGEGGTGTGSVLGLIMGVGTEPEDVAALPVATASEFVVFSTVVLEGFLEASVFPGTSCLCFD